MVTLIAEGVVTVLPNPDLGNAEGLNVEVNYREAMSGKPWVYRKSTAARNIVMTWSNLGRGKLVELVEFFKAFIGSTITVIDHNDVTWNTIFDQSTLNITTDSKAGDIPEGRAESGTVTLSFVGTKLSA